MRKLRMDLDNLSVDSLSMGAVGLTTGTVHGNGSTQYGCPLTPPDTNTGGSTYIGCTTASRCCQSGGTSVIVVCEGGC